MAAYYLHIGYRAAYRLPPMNLNQVRDYTRRVIRALHDAGWHVDAHGLSNDLYSISYQPLPKDYLMVLESAERLAGSLIANGCPAPVLA